VQGPITMSDGRKEILKGGTYVRHPDIASILLNWHHRRGKEILGWGRARNGCDNVSSC
jgi:hypothetical protein